MAAPDHPPPSADRSLRWLPAALAAAAALAVYAVTLGGTYVYDDIFLIKIDARARNPALWYQYWTTDYFNGGLDNLFRPLVSMTYAIQWWLHGDRPWAFHLVNWLLHAGASAAVAELARRLAGWRVAVVVGVLFAVHPVHIEAVANIVGRAELICTLAVAAALLLFVRQPMTTGRALAVWACAVVAVLSKEQGILLPLMLLAAWFFHTRGTIADPPAEHRHSMRLLLILTLWTFAGYLIYRETILRFWWDRVFLDWTNNPLVLSEGIDRIRMPLVLLGRYAVLLVAPVELVPSYGGVAIGWRTHWGDPFLWVGIVVVLAWWAAFVIALRRRNGTVVFCLIGLALSYGLVSNLGVLIGTNFAERVMYLPSAFFLIIGAVALSRLPRAALVLVVVIVTGLYAVRTYTYAALWNDPLALLEYATDAQPGAVGLHMLLAEERARRGDWAGAVEAMADARRTTPDYAMVWVRSALLAADMGDYDKAREYLREGFRLDPRIVAPALIEAIDQRRPIGAFGSDQP